MSEHFGLDEKRTSVDGRDSLILDLASPQATVASAGGKGASLARLARAGVPVPCGFVVTTTAYRHFVAGSELGAKIAQALAATSADDTAACDQASATITDLFTAHPIPVDLVAAVTGAYQQLGTGEPAVAVRSSATTEDLADASFAGQHESFLNVGGIEELLDAIRGCWSSLWSARAIGYRLRRRLPADHVSLAVVIQELVAADAAGVIFTADPVTGGADRVIINAAWGLGDAVVGGRVTPDTVVVDKDSRAVLDSTVNVKAVRTVVGKHGVHDEAVPAGLRQQPVVDPREISNLIAMAAQIEALSAGPVDIEWARSGDHRLWILQSRPITALPISGTEQQRSWNASLDMDALWTRGNVGEAVPDVVTPCSRSVLDIVFADMMPTLHFGGYAPVGYIGGRLYLNLSLVLTMLHALGMSRHRLLEATGDLFGNVPDDVEIPTLPVRRWTVIKTVLPATVANRRRIRRNVRLLPAFLADAPQRCEDVAATINAVRDKAQLEVVWSESVLPLLHTANLMLEAGSKGDGGQFFKTRRVLRRLVGDADTNTLLSAAGPTSDALASLGLLHGLTRLLHGDLDRAAFRRDYGHHSPHLFEISRPRPREDPQWVNQQLAGLQNTTDTAALLSRQQEVQRATWARFHRRHPRRARALQPRIVRARKAAQQREAARSEQARVIWVVRTLVTRAADLSGVGDDIFFLSVSEILSLLAGDTTMLPQLAPRRATYQTHCRLPEYPALIRGAFHPQVWAADPHRRSDVFPPRRRVGLDSDPVRGFPGAAGTVTGRARVAATVEDGVALQPGEVLVTSLTNVGWTPLFPRVAAIVTDIGAPLSHAAIVARELGIPAVVGCGDATMRIRTGDTLLVDGAAGTVTVLTRTPSPSSNNPSGNE